MTTWNRWVLFIGCSAREADGSDAVCVFRKICMAMWLQGLYSTIILIQIDW